MAPRADLLRVEAKPPPGRSPPLPPSARRLVAAVRGGRGDAFLPPVVRRGPEGVLQVSRGLSGDADALRVQSLLVRPGFRPLLELLETLDAWCASLRRQYPELFGPRVLTVTNAELFGPLVSEAFTLCAAAGEGPAHPGLPVLWEGFQSFFSRFLVRLARDVRAGVFRREGFTGPVVSLWMNPEETHNGRQSVLRLRFRQGGAVAYKPRPAGGEALFLAEGRGGAPGSLFELLNGLPAASGEVHLPTLRILQGRGADRFAYSWQEWVSPPRQWGTLRESEHLRLAGCRLTPREAEGFWHRAGSLTGVCFALGVADLFAGNVLVGARKKDRRPVAYPVDLELFFAPLQRLPETGLVSDARERGNHHVAFERSARWCTTGGPLVCFTETRGGGLRLQQRTRPWAREEAHSVVADTEGRVGFGAYLPAYLRGMFDAWTLLMMEKARVVKFLRRASQGRFVRVLVKPTVAYGNAMDGSVLTPGKAPTAPQVRFSREEREQMLRLDVPYFFRSAQGGPLLYLTDPFGVPEMKEAGRQHFLEPHAPPAKEVLEGERMTLVNLGVAVRDAVEFVFADVRQRAARDARLGVSLDLKSAGRGTVSFDWPQVGKRLTYTWSQRELQVSMDPL
jgi:hypothetical protein